MNPRAIVLMLSLACGPAGAGAPVTIALRPQARVAGPVVTLGDVAVLSSSELDPLRMLVNLPLGRAPAAGETVTVQREAVAGWLRAKSGLADDVVRWSGPASTQLVAAIRRVSGEEIAAAAETALRDWLAARAQRSDLQLQSLPRDLEAPEGELRLRPRALDATAPRSRMLVWVEVWVAERFVRSVAVPFHVSAEDLLAPPLDGPAPTPAPREVKLPRQVDTAPVVQRGQWASMRLGSGAVTLEARVEVLQDGRLGDSVRVRQQGAAGGVIARVTGPGQLELAR
ncbi:MAG: flagella basal body P-ring formation protein FlgA [Ramlibacter sp.]|nr:flagella basal body P-ring formation protein FlgA [Ramlibacter sp.]